MQKKAVSRISTAKYSAVRVGLRKSCFKCKYTIKFLSESYNGTSWRFVKAPAYTQELLVIAHNVTIDNLDPVKHAFRTSRVIAAGIMINANLVLCIAVTAAL